MLQRYPWPGNVRELRNVLERAVIVCEGSVVEPRHLPPGFGQATQRAATAQDANSVRLGVGTTVEEAEKLLNESLAIVQRIEYRSGIGSTLDRLGLVAQMSNPEKARTLFASSCDVFTETGDLRSLSRVFSHQGYNSFALGDVADAQASFIAALRLAHEGGYAPYVLDALVGLASLQAKWGDGQRALELLLIALNHPAKTQEIMDRAGQLQRNLESQLPARQVKAIRARAEGRTFEAAVEEALSLPWPGRGVE